MSDGIRRIIAILVLVAGAALLWVTGNSSHSAEAANNEIRATVAANQELAADFVVAALNGTKHSHGIDAGERH